MNEAQLYWLAGILEGEGCFNLVRNGEIVIKMTDRDVIERVGRLFGDKKVLALPDPNPRHQTQYRVRLRGAPARKIMEQILPIMGERRAARIRAILAEHPHAPESPETSGFRSPEELPVDT
jgi:hypothetical protein